MRVFVILANLAAASVQAEPLHFDAFHGEQISYVAFVESSPPSKDSSDEPIAVSVGVPAIEGGIREDWYATLGYARGVHWFAPEGGKMYYAGTSKPKKVMVDCDSGKCRFSFFPPAQRAAPCPPSK